MKFKKQYLGFLVVAVFFFCTGVRAATLTVTSTADSGVGSLREAIGKANLATGADEIRFSLGEGAKTITLTSGTLIVSSDVALIGPSSPLSISGNKKRIFRVGGYDTYCRFSLSNMTLSDGVGVEDGAETGDRGGAIQSTNSQVSIEKCSFTNNSVLSDVDSSGGAISCYRGSLVVSRSTFRGNRATQNGGAIDTQSADLTIRDCTFDQNKAPTGSAIDLRGGQGSIVNATFLRNVYEGRFGQGGIVSATSTVLTLASCTLTQNELLAGQTVISASRSDISLKNSVIASNGTSQPLGGKHRILENSFNFLGDNTRDPKLGPLQSSGGNVPTLRPLPDSPLLDAGRATVSDANGQMRPQDFAGIANAQDSNGADIGAVELDSFGARAIFAPYKKYTVHRNSQLKAQLQALDFNSVGTKSYRLVTQPQHGSMANFDRTTGAFTYRPASGYLGADSFTWQTQSSAGDSNVATVSLNVVDNTAPTLKGSNFSLTTGQSAMFQLEKGSDAEDDALPYSIVSNPSHGTIRSLDLLSGIFTYLPALGFIGTDSFSVRVHDSYGGFSTPATITLQVQEKPSLQISILTSPRNPFDGETSFLEAIDFANSSPDASTVEFDRTLTGTIRLTDYIRIDAPLSLVGNGPDRITISGSGSDAFGLGSTYFYPLDGGDYRYASLTFKNLRFTNFRRVISAEGSADIRNCVFEDNGSEYNGSINGSAIAAYVPFTGEADPDIRNSPQLAIYNSRFTNNGGLVQGTPGGAVSSNIDTTLSNCVFDKNKADVGGAFAISAWGHSRIKFSATRCLFTGNSGLRSSAISAQAVEATVENCTFAGNTSREDSVLNMYYSQAMLKNCTFTNNASEQNSAILKLTTDNNYLSSLATFVNCTLVGNTSASGSGTFSSDGAKGETHFINTVLNKNGTIISPDSVGIFKSLGHNISDGNETVFRAIGDKRLTDAKLGKLQQNGGIVPTMALLPGSPAQSAGDDAVLNAPYNLVTDARGSIFQRKVGAHVDSGAFEATAARPFVSISFPANEAILPGLYEVRGTASDEEGVKRVALTLFRRSDDRYWNGTAWVTTSTLLPATMQAPDAPVTVWNRASDAFTRRWPAPGNNAASQLIDGSYTVTAYAFDEKGNISAPARATVSIDHTPPTIVISSPNHGATLTELTDISGSAHDEGSGIERVSLYLHRLSDDTYWNGSVWTTQSTPLQTSLSLLSSGVSWEHANSIPTGLLPTGSNLRDGSYTASSFSHDRAGNTSASVTARFTIKRAAQKSIAPTVVLSSGTAIENGSIRLVFSGPLAASALNPASYTVTNLDSPISVNSISMPDTSTVVLHCEPLPSSSAVLLRFRIEDSQGHSLMGEARIGVN